MKEKLTVNAVDPNELLKICFSILEKKGVENILSQKRLSDLDDFALHISDPNNLATHVSRPRIEISWLEALSLCSVSKWFNHKAKGLYKYQIGVQIDDVHESVKELYLSDGLLIQSSNNTQKLFPFQCVVAQNIVGDNTKKDLEDEVIQQITKKVRRRETYHESSGLIVGILTNGGTVDLKRICDVVNTEAFKPSFMVVFHEDFKYISIFLLNGQKSFNRFKNDGLKLTMKSDSLPS